MPAASAALVAHNRDLHDNAVPHELAPPAHRRVVENRADAHTPVIVLPNLTPSRFRPLG